MDVLGAVALAAAIVVAAFWAVSTAWVTTGVIRARHQPSSDGDVLAVADAAGVVREPTADEEASYLEWLTPALRTPEVRLMNALLGYPREGKQR